LGLEKVGSFRKTPIETLWFSLFYKAFFLLSPKGSEKRPADAASPKKKGAFVAPAKLAQWLVVFAKGAGNNPFYRL
jgi:hypothetical protein